MPIAWGLFGQNGHQVLPAQLERFSATYAFGIDEDRLSEHAARCESFESLLRSPTDAIAVCAPLRAEQHLYIERALRAGKHVLAEKPAAMDAGALARLIKLAREGGLLFAEMNPVNQEQPYAQMREMMKQGAVGRAVQVFAQKSYPHAPWRPANEDVDGGLILQNAIHGLRMVEHVALQRVTQVSAVQTALGGRGENTGLTMACVISLRLAGGGVGTVIANYLNDPSTGVWGNEALRIFGDRGILQAESRKKGVEMLSEKAVAFCLADPPRPFFDRFSDAIEQKEAIPKDHFDPETAFHPTFVALAARESARSGGEWVDCG